MVRRKDSEQNRKGKADDRWGEREGGRMGLGVSHTKRSSSSMRVGSSLCMAIFCSWLLYLTSQMPGGSRMPPLDCLSAYICEKRSV